MTVREQEARHSLSFYPQRDLVLVRGRNATVWDDEGRAYLDAAGGHGVVSVGHGNERVAAAVEEQVRRLGTCPATFPNPVRARLLERLARLAPGRLNRTFLCNSGTEAVEAALKLARAATGRTGIVALRRGFHGRTMGALSTSFRPQIRKPFEPLLPGVRFVPPEDPGALREALDPDTAALILEPVQGEGGVHPLSREYLEAAREACTRNGTLLVGDEVQTGFGRTGRMFALEHSGVVPDLLCLAKAMGGGLPAGAVMSTDDIEAPPGGHGSTNGGNPLACAAALAVLDEMEERDLPARAAELGGEVLEDLKSRPPGPVRDVRGMGLMIGLQLRGRVGPVLARLQAEGILALPAGPTVLRLLPPLTIPRDQLRTMVDAVRSVLD